MVITDGGGGSYDSSYDYPFKIVLVGDSGVGKSSLIVKFVSGVSKEPLPTLGMDLEVKNLTIGGKKLKLTMWDTAGQEKYRSLKSSFYRDAQGIILVYDVTRRETFTHLSVWTKEVDLYSTHQDCIKVLVGNKVDKESDRVITREEGIAFAQKYGCSFIECSAKTGENVGKCFEELALKILNVPSLLKGSEVAKPGNDAQGSAAVVPKKESPPPKQESSSPAPKGGGCCS